MERLAGNLEGIGVEFDIHPTDYEALLRLLPVPLLLEQLESLSGGPADGLSRKQLIRLIASLYSPAWAAAEAQRESVDRFELALCPGPEPLSRERGGVYSLEQLRAMVRDRRFSQAHAEERWQRTECPTCQKTAEGAAEIQARFGWRRSRGSGFTRPQSLCRTCRSSHGKKMRAQKRAAAEKAADGVPSATAPQPEMLSLFG